MTSSATHLLRSRERKSTKIIITCKLTTDQLACILARQEKPQTRLTTEVLGGQAKTIRRLRGCNKLWSQKMTDVP
jgi:hypothetical protein